MTVIPWYFGTIAKRVKTRENGFAREIGRKNAVQTGENGSWDIFTGFSRTSLC
jgi:hypothetical protein